MFLLQVFLFVFEMFLIPENVGCFTFLLMDMEQRQLFSFVVMTMSVGMIIPNIWKNGKCSKPPIRCPMLSDVFSEPPVVAN